MEAALVSAEQKSRRQRRIAAAQRGRDSHSARRGRNAGRSCFFYIKSGHIRPGRTPWNRLRMQVNIRIETPATKPPNVHPRIVSVTSMWKNLEIAQKPESLGRERPIPPAQIAIAHRIGETPEVAAALAIIAEVVVRATVVEPCAQRRTWEITKQSTRIGILK